MQGHARLAQSVEHQTFNLRVAGSSPSSGEVVCYVPVWRKNWKSWSPMCHQRCLIADFPAIICERDAGYMLIMKELMTEAYD